MKNWKVLWAVIVILVVSIGFLVYALIDSRNQLEAAAITDFESCAAAGNPVMESYPAQCISKDGRHFVQEIAEPIETLPPFDQGDAGGVGGDPGVVACTLDAKQCPDGSYVGRVGPDCEFSPCPGE